MVRWLMVCLACVLAVIPTSAVVLRNGGTVTITEGQVINDDLVVWGGTVDMLGRVTNDLVVAGGTVNVNGPVEGDLFASGGTVNIRGPIGGSLYMAGGTVNLSSTIGRNAVIAGGTVNADNAVTIGRDLVVSGGTVTFSGKTTRDVRASAGTLKLTDNARVGRNLYAMASTTTIAGGAVIQGRRVLREPAEHERRAGRGAGIFGWIIWQLLTGLALLLTGIIFIAFAPRLTEETQGVIRRHPWASLLTGFLILIVVPFAVFILMITVIGIPLALILLWLYLTALFLSPIFVAIFIGRLVLRRPGGNLFLALLIGIALLVLVKLIPILGFLVSLIAMLIGLGALFLTLQGRTGRPIYPVETSSAM